MSSAPTAQLGAEDILLYTALTDGPVDPDELPALVGLDSAAVARALDQLLRLRLVRRSLAEAGQYEAVNPELAAAELVAHIEAQAHGLLRHSQTVRRDLDSLSAIYHQARKRQLAQVSSELVVGSSNVRRRLHELSLQAREFVVAVHPTMASAEALADGLALDTELLARGVAYRVIFPHTARRQQHARDHLKALVDHGASIRTAAIVPGRLLIIDGEAAVIPLPGQAAGAAIVRDEAMIAFLANIFEHTWERATTLDGDHTPAEVLEEVELAILAQLSKGHTDEVIARRLGISTRTLRRYLTALSERFNAESRFQLGVAASESGLVHMPITRPNGVS